MKKNSWIIASIALLILPFAGCGKDTIEVVNDSTPTIEEGTVDTSCAVLQDYDRKVVVIFSSSSSAIVTGVGDSVTATVNGNYVTISNIGSQRVIYILTGTSNNGYLKIYSGRKQGLQLNNLGLINPHGAAINIQGLAETPSKGKRADIYLGGSSTLADGSSYTLTPEGEDEKGVLFSEGQIVINGNGKMNINASGKAGISSDDWVGFNSGCAVTITSSAGHGVRGKDYVLVSGGTLDISVSADGKKGISSDSLVRFEGGETTIAITGNIVVASGDTSGTAGVKADQLFEMVDGLLTITNSGKGGKGISCDGSAIFSGGTTDINVTGANFGSSSGGGHGPGGWGGNNDNSVAAKGIKCDGNITITDGVIKVIASNHEGIETKGTLTITGGQTYSQSSDDAINSASTMTISGGYVCAYSTGNDGLDANGNCYIQGGVIYAIGKNSPEMAIDANSEGGKKLYIQGGTIIALGNLESGAQLSQNCYQASSWTKNAWYSITVGDNTYAFKTPASGGNKLVVSGSQQPTVKSSVTVSGGTEMCNGMLVDNPTVSGGNNVNLSNYSGGGW